jgi:hypothetical protein
MGDRGGYLARPRGSFNPEPRRRAANCTRLKHFPSSFPPSLADGPPRTFEPSPASGRGWHNVPGEGRALSTQHLPSGLPHGRRCPRVHGGHSLLCWTLELPRCFPTLSSAREVELRWTVWTGRENQTQPPNDKGLAVSMARPHRPWTRGGQGGRAAPRRRGERGRVAGSRR